MTKYATAALTLASILASANATTCGWKYNWGSTCYALDDNSNCASPPCQSECTSGHFGSREACCEASINQHDHDGYTACVTGSTDSVGGGTAPTGDDKWYLDYSRTPDSCSQNCPVDNANPGCGGVLHPQSTKNTYDDAAACCGAELGWMNEAYCAALSEDTTYTGTNGYYVDSTEHICVKDCDGAAPCGGVMTQAGVTVYTAGANDAANIDLCCEALPWIDEDICASQSNPSSTGTNKWFIEGSICRKDCTGSGAECSTAGRYTNLFDTVDACCDALGWLDEDYCVSRSDLSNFNAPSNELGYTHKWYVVWGKSACAKDCNNGDPACDGLEANAVLHDTAEACCSAHLGSVDATACKDASEAGVAASDVDPTGTGDWYADYSISPALCVQDCPDGSSNPATCGGVAPRNAGVTLYDDPASCCAGKFGWYQQDLCTILSDTAGSGFTTKWYADQGAGVCKQDCDTSGGAASCAGNPTDFSQPMFDDATACCKAKLGWINESTCVSKSTNGANTPTVGTNKWFVNWQTNMCDKDCTDTSSNDGCRGIHDGTNVVMHDDAETCCAAHFSWINKDFCASRSVGATYSGLFYPDQGEGKCYEDCDPNQGGPICKGPPSDIGVPMYDDAETCCTSSVGWADKDLCAGATLAQLATDEYWINWTYNKCVKNCPEDTANQPECGGIAKSWNIKYASAATCCSQPAFNNVERGDCVKA